MIYNSINGNGDTPHNTILEQGQGGGPSFAPQISMISDRKLEEVLKANALVAVLKRGWSIYKCVKFFVHVKFLGSSIVCVHIFLGRIGVIHIEMFPMGCKQTACENFGDFV